MWGTIANLKENLNKIALDVHDDDDDDEILSIYAGSPAAVSDRRNSHGSAHSKSPAVRSRPLANGTDHAHPSLSEIEQYKAEIKRLQASEAEIKALSVNYAALLKEKEDHIVRLNKENGSLKQHLDATSAALRVSRTEASTSGTYSVKGSNDQSPNRQNKFTTQSKTESKNSNLQGNEKELADLVDGRNRPTADAVQHTAEIEKLKLEMEQERARLAKIQLKCQEEQKLNKSFQEELKILKLDRDKTSMEMTKIRDELNEKVSEIKRLQIELTRRESDVAGEAVDSLKRLVKTLEKENATLKMEKNEIEAALETSRKYIGVQVLDLMVRMLGFSDEDKQRIGAAQQGGKVRGVLGLPGRLVGGILRGSSTDTAASAGSNDQSIADLWVDFLLKETEEREKRESSTANTADPIEDSPDKGPNTVPAAPPISPFSNHRLGNRTASAFSINQKISVPPRISNFNSEFSTVPLTPSDEKPSSSDLLPRF
ncbi:golgin candidate 3-like [Arachis ipaensis]|uniref:golgin candidate 3-like n=1 Tax=Arachis ipaensis TaxID=130454 RepID=UPI000A2B545C|nr:golgin candidate 3-like [Arachis ipaensis]